MTTEEKAKKFDEIFNVIEGYFDHDEEYIFTNDDFLNFGEQVYDIIY